MLSYTSPAEERRAHQALRLYRYLSWALTSAMYLFTVQRFNFSFAIVVVLTLLLAGHFAGNFYQGVGLTRRLAVNLILVETTGIALLLIPTGGLNSPFIWYALNPIFMAALMLPVKYCWLVLTSFLGAATLGSVLLFKEPLAGVWSGRSWLITAFLMITAAASVFSYLMTALRNAYTQLDKAHAEAEHLLVVQEQNRIANEIHDGVSQHLFSIVYALHSLSRQQANILDPNIQEQLQLISQTATGAAKELRASIYRIKPSQRAGETYVATLKAYLNDLAKLNDTRINFETKGSENSISSALRQAVTRIIKETVANAIRHGHCSTVDLELTMLPDTIELEIVDDGIGFEPDAINERGLGLNNMAELIASLDGSYEIESSLGKGTCVFCKIPAGGND